MGSYLDLAAENAGLKEFYDGQKVENLAYDKNPLLAMMPKEPNATGKYVPIPIIYELSQGNSAQFSLAQANQAPMQLAEFLLTLRPDYSLTTIQHQAALAAMDAKGGFLNFSKKHIDIGVQGSALRAGSAQFRAGTGSRGQISSITAGVILLTNPADIAQFGVNQTLQAASTDGGTPRAALGYVVARNVRAGTITVSSSAMGGAAGSPTSWAANDFLLVQGDSNATMTGLTGWLPSTDPTSADNFYGVNRSVDTRLFGIYYNGASQQPEEAIIDHAILLAREKGDPRHLIINYGTWSAIDKALGARREFVDWEGDGEFGFRGLKIQGPNGIIEMFADRNCQAATGFFLQMSTWTLYSLNPVPHIFNWGDGLEVLRLGNADAYEARIGFFANMASNAPGWNGQISFSV